jgi:hypothetical protein
MQQPLRVRGLEEHAMRGQSKPANGLSSRLTLKAALPHDTNPDKKSSKKNPKTQ